MKLNIQSGFLFPTQYWKTEFNENIEELKKECYLIKNNDNEGTKKSNTGAQGYHSKNIRSFENIPEIKKLINQIGNCVSSIHQLNRKGSIQLSNFWINICGKGGSNTPHTHSGSYSGVFFIKVPKEMKGGRFLFYRNFSIFLNSSYETNAFALISEIEDLEIKVLYEKNEYLTWPPFNEADLNSEEYMGDFKEGYKLQSYEYPIITIPPKENTLIVFPAWVVPAVETNLSDEDRISLSFNFSVKR